MAEQGAGLEVAELEAEAVVLPAAEQEVELQESGEAEAEQAVEAVVLPAAEQEELAAAPASDNPQAPCLLQGFFAIFPFAAL